MRRRVDSDDGGAESEPRGPATRVLPGNAAADHPQPGVRVRDRRGLHDARGSTPPPGGWSRSSWCWRARSRTRSSVATVNGRRSASTRARGSSDHDQSLDRSARTARRRRACDGHVRGLRGDPGDAQQPDRSDGLARPPGLGLEVAAGDPDRQPPRLSGPARQHHRDAAPPRCSIWPVPARCSTSTSRAGRSGCSAVRSSEGCGRAGFAEQGEFAQTRRIGVDVWSSSAARARW